MPLCTPATVKTSSKRENGPVPDDDQCPEWPASVRRASDAGAPSVVPYATTPLSVAHGARRSSTSVDVTRHHADGDMCLCPVLACGDGRFPARARVGDDNRAHPPIPVAEYIATFGSAGLNHLEARRFSCMRVDGLAFYVL